MPTYQYACTECGERLEVVQSFSDEPLTVCPVCQGRLRKVFSAVGVVFKGSGFYKTDSRSSGGSVRSSSSDSAKSGKDAKESSTSAASSSGSTSGDSAAPASSSSSTASKSDSGKVA